MSEIVQARLRHVFGLRTGALFFFLGGSNGAVLDPPNVLFFAVPELESCWGSAVSEPCRRTCFCSRISYGAGRASAIQRLPHTYHPNPQCSNLHPSISLVLAGSKVLPRPPVRKPMGRFQVNQGPIRFIQPTPKACEMLCLMRICCVPDGATIWPL